MLFQPSNVSPDEVNGTGCIDVSSNLEIAWQVNGNSAMTKYQVTIYKNDAASTFVYSTGVQTLAEPFWGTTYTGDIQYFSIVITPATMSTAGMANNNEYKIVITQWCAGTDSGRTASTTSNLAAGNYYLSLGGSQYANFTLASTLSSGSTITYSAHQQLITITTGGVFTTTTANVGSSHTGTSVASSAYSNGDDFVVQSTASVFVTRGAPTVTINAVPEPLPYCKYSFTATYSQAQGDPINWMRWELAETGDEDEPMLDTGKITGTGQLQVDYDGLFNNGRYSVRCTVETSRGVIATSGWLSFHVMYNVSGSPTSVDVCQPINRACLLLSWEAIDGVDNYAIYRREGTTGLLWHVATLPGTSISMWDYGVKSGNTYTYYLFPETNSVYDDPIESEPIYYDFWGWTILEAKIKEDGDYHVLAAYAFRYGSGGVNASNVTNNNSPKLNKTFTPYPNRQPDTANYMSGSVSGLINYKADAATGYQDTAQEADDIMALSVTTNHLFLKDPKGNFRKIHTSQPIVKQFGIKQASLPTTVTFPWVEIGSTEGISLVSTPGDPFYVTDAVIETTLTINLDDSDPNLPMGAILWTTPDNYSGGSILSLNANGALLQNFDWTFTPADMHLYNDTGEVFAAT